MKNSELNVKFTHPKAVMPEYAHPGDLGLDVYAVSVEYEKDTDTYVYHTGISMESNKGVGVLASVRSSNCRTQCYMPNNPGIIDTATYRGEIIFKFKNRTAFGVRASLLANQLYNSAPWYKKLFMNYDEFVKIALTQIDPMDYKPYEVGDKIGQLIVMKFISAECKKVNKLSKTSRGSGGFGSTDKKINKK